MLHICCLPSLPQLTWERILAATAAAGEKLKIGKFLIRPRRRPIIEHRPTNEQKFLIKHQRAHTYNLTLTRS